MLDTVLRKQCESSKQHQCSSRHTLPVGVHRAPSRSVRVVGCCDVCICTGCAGHCCCCSAAPCAASRAALQCCLPLGSVRMQCVRAETGCEEVWVNLRGTRACALGVTFQLAYLVCAAPGVRVLLRLGSCCTCKQGGCTAGFFCARCRTSRHRPRRSCCERKWPWGPAGRPVGG